MQTKLDNLTTKLEIINQFEALFAKNNVQYFQSHSGSPEKEASFSAYMNPDFIGKTSLAFDGFDFAIDSERGILVGFVISHLKQVIPETHENYKYLNNLNVKYTDNTFSFFYLAIAAFGSLNKNNEKTVGPIISLVRDLIEAQKVVVADEITEQLKIDIAAGEAKIQAERQKQALEAAKAFGKKALYYTGVGMLFKVGAGLTTFSALMQFRPDFALLVGVHLPVAALAVLAVTGFVMAAAAAYLAYRSYHPAAIVTTHAAHNPTQASLTIETSSVAVPNPLYAKLVTAGLMTSILVLTGFSLMAFSSAFALLTGLQLQSVALIVLAAVGVLLISLALYRLIKTTGNAPKPVVEDAEQPTDTCVQRFYDSVSSFCFKFSCKKPESNDLKSNQEECRTATL